VPEPSDDPLAPDRPPLAVAPARPRRLAYLGTPDVAVPPLRALHAAGFEIAVVVSRPDRRRGRGGALSPSPVKAAAADLGLPVTDELDAVLDAGVDLGVVVAYGRIIPRRVLEAVPMVNLHFSLLPRWRGAAPVERALLAGDATTGVCLMEVAEGLDTGAVYAVEETAVAPDDTLASLRGRLVDIGSRMLVDELTAGLAPPAPQVGEPTHAAKIDPAELEIDWSRPAVELDRLVRLGGAWTTFRGKRLKVWRAELRTGAEAEAAAAAAGPGTLDGAVVATGAGTLRLVEVQTEGKARQDADAWRNGQRPGPGDRLGA
jgi:methionyl-tRNA formyltransferase